MIETPERLRITFQNQPPVELDELAGSFSALADEYRRFSGDENGRLCVEGITKGSIDVMLIDGAVWAERAVIGGGVGLVFLFRDHWIEVLKFLWKYGREAAAQKKAKRPDRTEIRHAMQFVGPAAGGNDIALYGNNNSVVVFNIDQQTATDIIHNGRHLLAPDIVSDQRFENEPLKVYQARDAKAGDRGYIDRFSAKPQRLIFADDAVKAEMLHGEINPFDVIFFVSGIVKTAGGEIAGYHIDKIDGFYSRER